jgi:hypothetical protein
MKHIKTFNDGTEKMLWEQDGKYVVTSYIWSVGIHETMAFSADSSGRILSWLDLACYRGVREHEKCARDAFVAAEIYTFTEKDDCEIDDDYSI